MEGKVFVNGVVWGSAKPIVPPMNYEEFKEELLHGLSISKEKSLASISASSIRFSSLRSSFEIRNIPNLNNPSEVGWALLLPPEGPETREIAGCLAPLVQHRNGKVIFGKLDEEWIENEYTYKPENDRPYYILLAGSPSTIPFSFQYLLDTHAAVGRLTFDKLEEYEVYAKKVVDYEKSTSTGVERHAIVFAPALEGDVTYFSKTYMADVLVKIIQTKNIPVTYLSAGGATLSNFISTTGYNQKVCK